MDNAHLPDLGAHQFPMLDGLIYADHAAISPWPRVTAEAVRDLAGENWRQGALHYRDWLDRERELRRLIAGMLNAADGDDIALVGNTSDGVNLAAGGIDWLAGDNVVTAAGEFPTNRLPWDMLRARGVEVRRVEIRGVADPEAALLDAMDRRTRVLTVSSVQWQDGFRLRLEPLGAACRASGSLFFVDAIQEFGALPMDVRACHIDCLAAGAHKWQMGPEGIGIFYCSPEARARLALSRYGWRMLEHPFRYDLVDQAPAANARRFETGSPNMLGQAALAASLGLLQAVGVAEVGRRVRANSAYLATGLADMPGVRLTSDTRPERMSGIISFVHRDRASTKLQRTLERAGVRAALRDGAVRLSPHFYQFERQLEPLLGAVESVCK